MEGWGGHTKECKVRITTSANPFSRLPPPLRASSFLATSASASISAAHRFFFLLLQLYRPPLPEVTTHYHTRRSSPRFPLIVFQPVGSPLPSLPVSPPPERSSPGEKRRGKSRVSLCLRPDQRHSSLIHEWSLVGRRIPRLRTGSSTTLFPRHQRRGTLCSTIVEESVTGRESLVRRSTWRILLFFAFYSRK